jgi:hypothetical protein
MRKVDPSLQSNESGRDASDGCGVNLILIYGLMVLALLAAIGFAALIVLPFYHRR